MDRLVAGRGVMRDLGLSVVLHFQRTMGIRGTPVGGRDGRFAQQQLCPVE